MRLLSAAEVFTVFCTNWLQSRSVNNRSYRSVQRPWPWTIHADHTEKELAVALRFSKFFRKQCFPERMSLSHWYMLNLPACGAKTLINVFILDSVYTMEPDYCLELSTSQFFLWFVQGNSITSQSCCFSVGFLDLLRSQTLLRYHLIFAITCKCSWKGNCRH